MDHFRRRCLQQKALEPNSFALGTQKSACCSNREHIFTFSRTCCAKLSGGHTPQLRNTHFCEIHRDDDDFRLIWTLCFGALVFWSCTPSVLAPGMGRFDTTSGPSWPVCAPLKTPSWLPDCVQEAFCASFFLLLAHSNAYNIVACSKKMRIVPCFLKKGQLFKNNLLNICFSKVLLVRICFFCRVAFQ